MAVPMSVPILLLMAAQGAVVFLTARWGLQLLEISHWSGKIAAMVISYIAWIVFTVAAYTLGSGEGGMVDGGLLVLMLCFSAMISSFVYLLIWLFFRSSKAQPPEESDLLSTGMRHQEMT